MTRAAHRHGERWGGRERGEAGDKTSPGLDMGRGGERGGGGGGGRRDESAVPLPVMSRSGSDQHHVFLTSTTSSSNSDQHHVFLRL